MVVQMAVEMMVLANVVPVMYLIVLMMTAAQSLGLVMDLLIVKISPLVVTSPAMMMMVEIALN